MTILSSRSILSEASIEFDLKVKDLGGYLDFTLRLIFTGVMRYRSSCGVAAGGRPYSAAVKCLCRRVRSCLNLRTLLSFRIIAQVRQ